MTDCSTLHGDHHNVRNAALQNWGTSGLKDALPTDNPDVPAWAPNLIMPGVAKCGTTTLHDMLVAHPRIQGGVEKEVRFLMDRGDPLRPATSFTDGDPFGWARQYGDQGKGDFDYWLDASPQYQYQKLAPEVIRQLSPAPFILWIFRKPSARLYSLYQYARYHQRVIPGIASFQQFIDEVRTPRSAGILARPMLASAWADSFYDRTLDMWAGVVPSEKVRVVSLEQLAADRLNVLGGIASWLGIDPEPFERPVSLQSNPTVVTRSRLIRSLGSKASKLLPDNALVRQAKKAVRGWNTGQIDPGEKAANRKLLDELDSEFRPSSQRLKEMSGCDFATSGHER